VEHRQQTVARTEQLLAQTEWLGRLASRLVTGADRDDLIQDVLLRAMTSPAEPTHLRGWLATVARNLAARRRSREARRRERERAVARTAGESPSAAETVEAFATHRAVVDAVMALDEPYRTAVLLRFWEDVAPGEIARRTGAPVETVRTRIRRGLDRLRTALDEERGSRRAWLLPLVDVRSVRAALVTAAPPASFLPPLLTGMLTMKTATLAAATAAILVGLILALPLLGPRAVGMAPDLAATAPADSAPAADAAGDHRPSEALGRRFAVADELEPGSLTVRVGYADGAAAREVGVYLRHRDGFDLGLEGTTAADGRAAFVGLRPGAYRVTIDRGVESLAMVRPGLPSSCELQIDRGVLVLGRVVTMDAQPVAGARVFALDPGHHDGLRAVAATDAGGNFLLRDAVPGLELHARADGWQPSGPRDLARVDGAPGDRVEVEIRLGARGHLLCGRVVAEDGRALPHAWVGVAVDEDCRRRIDGLEAVRTDADGMLDRESFFVRADAEGRFRTSEVPWGDVVVFARGLGPQQHLVGSARLRVEPGVAHEVLLRLGPGGSLVGTVRDETGAAYEGLRLRVQFHGSLEIGELARGFGPELADRTGTTRADGSYRIDGLFAGEHRLRRVLDRGEQQLEPVDVEAGREQRVDLTLPRAWQLRVVLRSAGGLPLQGWAVMLSDAGTISYPAASRSLTDAGGVHLATGLRADRYLLSVHAPDPGGERAFRRFPSFVAQVERGAGELVVEAAPPAATIVGRVLDAGGTPVTRGRVECRMPGFGELIRTDLGADGGFRFERLPAGEFRLSIHGRDQPAGAALAQVRAGAVCELGDLFLPAPARLEVELRAADGGAIDQPELWLSRRVDDAGAGPTERVAGLGPIEGTEVWRSAALESGDYVLHVRGRDAAPVLREVRLVAGAPLRLQVTCVRGISQDFEIELGGDGPMRERPVRGSIEIRDLLGRRLVGRGFDGVVRPPSRAVGTLSVRLEPGRYLLVADAVGPGERVQRTIVVDGSPIRVVVDE
jgi:RNA polymerase sigma-70 factor (ECF subfamily)